MDRRQLKFNFEDLPEGWKVTNLGKFCEFYNGKAHEKCIDENGEFIVVNSKIWQPENPNIWTKMPLMITLPLTIKLILIQGYQITLKSQLSKTIAW